LHTTFGYSLNLAIDTYLGQEIRNLANVLSQTNEIVQAIYDALGVEDASGSLLAKQLSLIGIDWVTGAYSSVPLTFTATAATTVPAGTLCRTETGVTFATDAAMTLTGAGSDAVEATCTVVGPHAAAIGEVNTMVNTIYGISGVTNAAAATPGRLRATDAEMKQIHTTTVAESGQNGAARIYQALSEVTGVSAIYVLDNDTDAAIGAVPAHNVAVTVIGGADADIAAAIDNNKTTGVPSYGSTTVSVYNTTTATSHDINFSRGTAVPIYIALDITTIPGVFPDDGATTIKDALVAMFTPQEIRIGDDVVYTELYAAIYSVPGIIVNSYYLDTADPPTGTSDISISTLQLATLDADDIDITVH
jgi:uncharacterized phage protein gp47/JayE